jgi:large subunit ribosomal protein L3
MSTLHTILGTKRGMTQMWMPDGQRVPVTVIDAGPNTVVGLKSLDRDGYEAVQLGFGAIRPRLVRKPRAGQFAKAGIAPLRHVREVRGPAGEAKVGDAVGCAIFAPGSFVDVIGTSKGKGFQGTIKLHHFSRGPESHGSDNVRKPGSIGMHTHPGRTLKGKRMAARMGTERVTMRNLAVVSVDAEKNLLLVKGAVPGNNGGLLLVRASKYQPKAVK